METYKMMQKGWLLQISMLNTSTSFKGVPPRVIPKKC